MNLGPKGKPRRLLEESKGEKPLSPQTEFLNAKLKQNSLKENLINWTTGLETLSM